MSKTLNYRQQVADFRNRLNTIISGGAQDGRRVMVDSGGYRTRNVQSSSDEERLALYGQARHHSVARVLALLEIVREAEGLDRMKAPPKVDHRRALWQAFSGTEHAHACHTCPALLTINGELPTLITENRGLRRHIIVEFGDCILIPRSVNGIDKVVDEKAGREAFVRAAQVVLRESGADWQQGLALFKQQMRTLFDYVAEAMVDSRDFHAADPDSQEILDTFTAYYEGLYLHTPGTIEMRNFQAQVHAETAVP